MSVSFGSTANSQQHLYSVNCSPSDPSSAQLSSLTSSAATFHRSSPQAPVRMLSTLSIDPSAADRTKTKLKRCRQRVDAGEPRNTYSSIFCYSVSDGKPAAPYCMDALNLEPTLKKEALPFATSSDGLTSHSLAAAAAAVNTGMSPVSLKGLVKAKTLQQSNNDDNSQQGVKKGDTETDSLAEERNGFLLAQDGCSSFGVASSATSSTGDASDDAFSPRGSRAEPTNELHQQRQKKARVENIISYIHSSSPCVMPSSTGCSPDRMQTSPVLSDASGQQLATEGTASEVTRSRRKRYQPKQLEVSEEEVNDSLEQLANLSNVSDGGDNDNMEVEDDEDGDENDDDDEDDDDEEDGDEAEVLQGTSCIANGDEQQLKQMQKDLFLLQRRYIETLQEHQKRAALMLHPTETPAAKGDVPKSSNADGQQPERKDEAYCDRSKSTVTLPPDIFLSGKEMLAMTDALKEDLIASFNSCVEKSMQKYYHALKAAAVEAAHRTLPAKQCQTSVGKPLSFVGMNPVGNDPRANCPGMILGDSMPHMRSFYCSPFGYTTALAAAGASAPFGMGSQLGIYFSRGAANSAAIGSEQTAPPGTIYPGQAPQGCFGFHPAAVGLTDLGSLKPAGAAASLGDQSPFASSSLMPRKRRNKVTDTRVNRVNSIRPDETHPMGYLPSMVAPGCACGIDDADLEPISPDNCAGIDADGSAIGYDSAQSQNTTLTPMHLRKAKLMFFYTRYPSSVLLKAYFPDIRFNKNNTAQLVKWFSNFREFYYIQMEKYARQAIAEGVRSSDDLRVTTDSELYKVLNLHYNRNNHVMAPVSFRRVVEATLHEFFNAIHSGRDMEPSWKKSIYKVIARMDDPIPEYFKTPNFLETLE
ncbi:hypothetical protein M514_10712 [Trichuris suis]|uniref:Prospero domain-containing protein n=1 Tax=Trichuris suis TaxID=68888 RepID=A0A085LTW6_9BILA|nr:hypothetical protein M513_10712 [Trichuris suis]KFD62444.1 hypothetical protein M514_10712 [Trichuris suis]